MTFSLASGFSAQGRVPHCSFCGRGPGKEIPGVSISADRPVVTSDLSIDMEGFVEMCVDCAAEAGSVVGLISAEKAADLEVEVQRLSEELSVTGTALEVAQTAVDSLANELARREDDEDA